MTPLCKLCKKCGCDKGGEYHPYGDLNRWSHCYTPVYWELFKGLRKEPITLLEIGVSEGRSMNLWKQFFPKGRIIGWDIAVERAIETDPNQVELRRVDQGSAESIRGALYDLGIPWFDIIIDDGSHIFQHQAVSFAALRMWLRPHGFYVIEDATTELPVLDGWKNKVYRWPLDKRQKDASMGDMLQVIRRA